MVLEPGSVLPPLLEAAVFDPPELVDDDESPLLPHAASATDAKAPITTIDSLRLTCIKSPPRERTNR
jgi:hypothetical protein